MFQRWPYQNFACGQQYVSNVGNISEKLIYVFFPNWQNVRNIEGCVEGSPCLITSFPMINREWVTLHILWKAVSSHLLPWSTGCEWHCTFCERQSHHIFSYDQQLVSDIAHFVKGSFITSFPMTNSLWVILHIFVKGSFITSFPITNSKWVMLHILWKAVSSHLFLWPTASEWHCPFCGRQSHHIFCYNQQSVSDIKLHAYERQSHHIFCNDQQGVSDIAHFVKGSLITFFPTTNREWVTVHNLWKAVSSHLLLWPTACEWHCTFCEGQSHHIFSWPIASEWYCTLF